MSMGSKNISIMDDVYNLLQSKKTKNESFSEVIRREINKKGDVMEFAGAWEKISNETVEKMKKEIKNIREKSTKELFENDIY